MHHIKTLSAILAVVALMIGFTTNAAAQNGKSMKQDYGATYSPCNGETIETTGTMNIVMVKEEVDENGCTSVQVHMNTQGVKGVGMGTGNEYKIIDIFNSRQAVGISCGGCLVELETAFTWKVMTKDGQSFTNSGTYHVILNFCTFEVEEIRVNFNKNNGCS